MFVFRPGHGPDWRDSEGQPEVFVMDIDRGGWLAYYFSSNAGTVIPSGRFKKEPTVDMSHVAARELHESTGLLLTPDQLLLSWSSPTAEDFVGVISH